MSERTVYPLKESKTTTLWSKKSDKRFHRRAARVYGRYERRRYRPIGGQPGQRNDLMPDYVSGEAHRNPPRLRLATGTSPDDVWGKETAEQIRQFIADMQRTDFAGAVLLGRTARRSNASAIRGYGIGSVIFGKQLSRTTYYRHHPQQGKWVSLTDDPHMDRPDQYVTTSKERDSVERHYRARYLVGTTLPHNVFVCEDGFPWLNVNQQIFRRRSYGRLKQEGEPNFAARLPFQAPHSKLYGSVVELGSFSGKWAPVASRFYNTGQPFGIDDWPVNFDSNLATTFSSQPLGVILDQHRARAS